jgi:hypothetical protein
MSPFVSEQQRKFMFAKHPKIAKRWAKLGQAWKKAKFGELEKEEKEHPTLPIETVKQIVKDHKKLDRKKLAMHWRKAKHGSMAQIPEDYKKKLDGQAIAMHGSSDWIAHDEPPERIPMDEYAEIEAQVLKEGEWPDTTGVSRKYSWVVIERDMGSFTDREFYLSHPDNPHGGEMGRINAVHAEDMDGEKWACFTVRVPETDFTNAFLGRIENGLISDVSSVHRLRFSPEDPGTVTAIHGDALGTVRHGIIPGAKIYKITRHIKSPRKKKMLLGIAWKKAKEGNQWM